MMASPSESVHYDMFAGLFKSNAMIRVSRRSCERTTDIIVGYALHLDWAVGRCQYQRREKSQSHCIEQVDPSESRFY